MAAHRTYRTMTLLYPKVFRAQYRDDLVQHHSDLVRERGPVGAWLRSGLDLVITVPLYRLESTMNNRYTPLALNLLIGTLGMTGAAILIVGFPIGALLLGVAVIIAFTQRSNLARSLREATPVQRRHRFVAAAVLAALAGVVLLISFNDNEWGDRGALIYSTSFLALITASVGSLVVALASRTHTH